MGTQFFWIFDVAVAAIFLGYIFMGIRKGFISVLLSLLALVLAFCVALFTSGSIAEAIYDNMISDAITEEVSTKIDDLVGGGLLGQLKSVDTEKAKVNGRLLSEVINEQSSIGKVSIDLSRLDMSETGIGDVDLSSLGVSEYEDFSSVNLGMVEYSTTDVEKYGINTLILSSVLAEEIKNGTALGVITDIIDTVADSLPFFASDSTPQTGTEIGSVIEKIAVSMLTTTHTDNLAHRITDDIIRPVLLVPMRTLIFVIIFVIILIIVNLIARLFRTINHIPVIGGINKLFGAVAGFAQGAIVIFLVCIFVQFIVSLTGNEIIFLNTMTIDETHLFKHIYYFDFLNFTE